MMDFASVIAINMVENLLHYITSKLVHWLSQYRKQAKPINLTLLIKCFLESLQLKFFEENSILLKCFIQMLNADNASLIGVIIYKRSINSSKVWIILVLIKCQLDLTDKAINLSIQLHSKKCHQQVLFLYNIPYLKTNLISLLNLYLFSLSKKKLHKNIQEIERAIYILIVMLNNIYYIQYYHFINMFEKLLQKLLRDVVGEFIDGIDTKKLNIGIWSGTVEIINVSLKPRLLAMLGLPYKITYSNISRLFITIPWKNLFTAPLVIQIQSIQVLAQNSTYQLSRQQQGKLVLLKIKQFIQKLARELANDKKNQQKNGGYLETVYLKMLDNLYLTIKNIHFRFEVSKPLWQQPEATPFAFGITLQSIQVFAVDEKGNKVFIDRTKLTSDKNIICKKLKLENFGFYWNYEEKDTILLSLQAQQTSENFYKSMLDLKQILAGKGLAKQKMNYVILVNAEGLIKEDNRLSTKANKITKYEILFDIKQIKMMTNERIIKQMVWFLKQTKFLSSQKKTTIPNEGLEKWQGPKNQNFLGLLRKYCINQFWGTDNNSKSNTSLTAPQERMLIDYLYENKQRILTVQGKVKQIIVGDIGSKNAINKSQIISNWQSIQALMLEQKKIEQGKLQITFNFLMEQLSIFYIDEVKIPIAQILMKGFQIIAEQSLQKELRLDVFIDRLQGFGYDQNPIIRMEHQIESPDKYPKVMERSKLLKMSYKYSEQIGQEIEVVLGGIGFFYDFKTFREIYKLSEGLMSSKSQPKPTSPPSLNTPQQNSTLSSKPQNELAQKVKTKISQLPSQITITIQNVSLYILQYTKKTWRLSMSGCQLTNNQSLVPQNILIHAISLSVSDFYVLEPFGAKIVLNLRQQIPDISVVIEPVRIKISSETLKCFIKIPSCLQTYKKSDAISLSSKYGELYLLDDKDIWKKFDGVVIDGYLYLYEKSDEYSKYQLKVINAFKTQSNKRQVIQLTIKTDQNKGTDKLHVIVKNSAQFDEWYKYLSDLSDQNAKQIARQQQKIQAIKDKQLLTKKPQIQQNQVTQLSLFLIIESLIFKILQNQVGKQQQPILALVVKKSLIQYSQTKPKIDKPPKTAPKQIEMEKKTSKFKSCEPQQFKQLKQMRVSRKMSKRSQKYSQFVSIVELQAPQKLQTILQDHVKQQKCQKIITIQIQNIQYWFKKFKRLSCEAIPNTNASDSQKLQDSPKNSISIKMALYQNKMNANIQIKNRIKLDYQPYQILQTMSYINSQIFNIFKATPKNYKIISNPQDKFQRNTVQLPEIEPSSHPKFELILILQAKEGCQVNFFNILTYKNSDSQRQRVLKIEGKDIKLSLDENYFRVEASNLTADWFTEGTSHSLITSFGTNNQLKLQIINKKLLVRAYRVYLPNYQHYLTMRAIDYLLCQVKQVLLYPFNFNQYFDQFSQGDKSTHTRMYRFKNYVQNNMTQSQIWQRIKSVFSMQVEIYEAYAFLQGIGYITVGFVNIVNQVVQNYNISIKSNIICDQYLITFKDLNIWLIMDKNDEQVNIRQEQKAKRIQMQQKLRMRLSNRRMQDQNQMNQLNEQERFYTVLNRFEETFNDSDWSKRIKMKLVQAINSQCPLDLSLSVTMFGKYPQYKTLFPRFEAAISNTSMKVALKSSELHINFLPSQLYIFLQFVQQAMENIFYTDNKNYLYSYDEQVIKKVYLRQAELHNDSILISQKQKANRSLLQIKYDVNKQIVITVPLQSFISSDEYIYCPIQFKLDVKNATLKSIIISNPIPGKTTSNNLKVSEKTSFTGLEASVQNFSIYYTQYPQNTKKISFDYLLLQHLTNQTKTKVAQFTSALERISRETMFIDNSGSKYDNKSKVQFLKTKYKFVNSAQKLQMNIENNIQPNEQPMKAPRIESLDKQKIEQEKIKNNQKEAFYFKLYEKRNQQKIGQKHNFQQNDIKGVAISVKQFCSQNLVIFYDKNAIDSIMKLTQKISQQGQKYKKQQNNEGKNIKAIQQIQQKRSQIICRFHNLLLKAPIITQSLRQFQVSEYNSNKNYKCYDTFCVLLKGTAITQIPSMVPLQLNLDYFQAYMQQTCEDVTQEQKSKANLMNMQQMIYQKEQRNSTDPLKNKRKSLLQPTRISLSKKKSRQLIKKALIKQKQENVMKSRIKSMLKLSPDQPPNLVNNQVVKEVQFQLVPQLVILNQIEVERIFVKISVQDIKLLNILYSNLKKQYQTFTTVKKQQVKVLQSEINKTKKQSSQNSKINKKAQFQQKFIQAVKPQQNKSIQAINQIKFKPLQIVIMNDSNMTNTPLIYIKVHIQNYEKDQFNTQIISNYFNLRVNAWQPLIQKCTLLVKLDPHLSISNLVQERQEKQQKEDKNKSSNNKPQHASQRSNKSINFNISTNFIEALIPALKSTPENVALKRLSEVKSTGDQVNCWLLINQLGYDISCQSKSFRGNRMSTTINIPNNKTKKLTFLNDLSQEAGFQTVLSGYEKQQFFGLGENEKSRLTISIIINNQFRIKQIDIGEIGIKKLCFNYEGNPYWIYGHTYVDISKNVKYVKFYSEVMIYNSTNLDLWIQLPQNSRVNHEQPNQQSPKKLEIIKQGIKNKQQKQKDLQKQKIRHKDRKLSHGFNLKSDVDYFQNQYENVNTLAVRNKSDNLASQDFEENSEINEKLETSFRKAHEVKPNCVKIPANKEVPLPFDLDESFKKFTQNQFLKLISRQPPTDVQGLKPVNQNVKSIQSYQSYLIHKERKKMRSIFRILPSGKLVNKLPETINVALKAQQHILYAFTMNQDEQKQIYTYFNQLEVSLHADGFQWSVFAPCSITDSIALYDYNNNKLNIKINTFVDEDDVTTVIMYPIAVLYNDLDYDIHIRDPECKNNSYNKVLPKKAISLSNNRVLVLKPDLPPSTNFTSSSTNYTKIYMNQQQITCKFTLTALKHKQFTERNLQHIPSTATQALLINQVILKTSSGTKAVNQIINTKFVTVSHKYYFSNQTQYTILIRKYTGDETTKSKSSNFNVREYQPNSMQSFWLFDEDVTTSKQSLTYYELTIKNSPYEWSGALSITKQGNNHFILRNRAHFGDVLFLNLSVIKYHKIQKFKIQLKIVSKEDPPYIIKNSWPRFLIKLPEYGNLVLKQGDHIQYSWDQPILRGQSIPILVGYAEDNRLQKVNFLSYFIKTQNPQLNQYIKLKKIAQMGEVAFSQNNQTKIFQLKEYQKLERKTERQITDIQLPIRIALINNSFTPAYHLLDFSANLNLKISKVFDAMVARLNLDQIQLDNQTRYRVYFPVVLSTSLLVTANIGRNVQIDVEAQPVVLNIQQDFGRDLYATAMLIAALVTESKGLQPQNNRFDNQIQNNNKILVSRLSLPQVSIKLQVKTKKLSIETTINLQKPAITKYPWPSFPYPIKNIAITLLSHLSISPWALISSFQKGVVSLLTQQQSTKGIQGFFGQILAAVSNSINGLIGILVGHDIQRVDNFFDGIEQGSNLLAQQIFQIKQSFEPEQCTIPSILTSFGYGIISIILKPMKGVLQMTLKISQGIKKTALFSFQVSQNKFRQRDAIVFYGQQQLFRTYDSIQSQLMVMLLKICGEPLKYFHLVKFYVVANKLTNHTLVLCVGTEQVILFNAKTQKLLWKLNLHEVSKMEIDRYSCIRFHPFQFQFDAFNQDLAQQIYGLLTKIHKKVYLKT